MIRNLLCLGLLASLSLSPAFADDAGVKKAVEAFLNGPKVDEVRKLAGLELYEIRIDDDILYTDEKVSFLVAGNLIDVKTRKNLTQARQQELSTIKFSELPLDLAVKNVRGKGRRTLVTFEDPNCGYCKQLAKELVKIDDVTIYTFLLPILAQDSESKSRAVWCSSDRAKAWVDLMLNNKIPAAAAANCSAPTEKVKELAKKFRINGTPTMFLTNGQRVPGFVPVDKLDEMLKTASAK